ncbi:hypothetical protein [Breznakia pachnodae]|uniref:Internalin I Ig-like domain-containing protein n=1 Tax=Breznakia pachnodae TaxID=265178 RepID=A0ABU0E0S4_9FIRM|nr:hypothetical protein [Breznakia pachnodae]MDQ0360474.1 hypothetical protein [Breznakia pachnodae]
MRDIIRKFSLLPKKSVGIGGVGILIIVIVLAIALIPKNNKENLKLKKSIFEFEYGEEIELLTSDILKTTDKEILENAKISMLFPTEKVENGKDIIKVGTYTQRVTYKDEEKEFKVKVKDTVAPEFVDFKERIEVKQGTESVEYIKYFAAEDLAGVSIDIDYSKVDLTKVGEYIITVTAVDNHKNETKKEAIVVVKDNVED